MHNSPPTVFHRTVAGHRSNDQARPYIDCLILFLLPSIVNLTSLPQIGISRTLLSLLFISLLLKNVFVYSAISQSWGRRVSNAFGLIFSRENLALLFLMALLALFAVADLRAGYIGLLSPIGYLGSFVWTFAILLYLLSVVSLNDSDASRRMLMMSLVCGLGFFVALNVASYLAGLRGINSIESTGENKILSLMGIQAQRARLPFTTGINNFGAMAGLAAVAGFALARSSRGVTLFLIGSLVSALGFFGGVLADSRGSLGISVLVCVIVVVLTSRAKYRFGLNYLPILVLIAPILIYGSSYIVSNTGLANLFVREGQFAQRLGVLTGRDFVWESAFRILSEPVPMHLIGYGTFGQVTSGATKGYAWIFLELPSFARQSLHNISLQMIFDIGYIGLFIWICFSMFLIRDLLDRWDLRKKSFDAAVPVAMVCSIFLGGIIEVVGPYYPDVLVLIMFLTAWSLPLLRRAKSTSVQGLAKTVGIVPRGGSPSS